MKRGSIELNFRDTDSGLIELDCSPFHLETSPALRLNEEQLSPTGCRLQKDATEELQLEYQFGSRTCLTLSLSPTDDGIALRARLLNASGSEQVLCGVTLLQSSSDSEALSLGEDPARVMVMEQGNYWGKVLPLAAGEVAHRPSDLFWVAFDRDAQCGFLAGFTTSERWRGQIELETDADGAPVRWALGFDGGDLLLEPGQEIELEEVLLLAGPDPWVLLETYADAVADRHHPQILDAPPVSWCSWYPYRLGVSEDRILAEASIAAERLKPLGLSLLEVDLGWEWGNLPSTFNENERFPHGLGWLSDQLRQFGFDLGVWKAPFSISEHDPICSEHPEWLVRNEDGEPVANGEWYWEPHGKIFILDLTHPGAQQYLREQISSLHDRGVRYFKADFIGCVSSPLAKNRHDRTIVGGGGYEAARIGARIIRESLPDGLPLNCGGPEMPGTGYWPLFYTCNDTGNTGFISQEFKRENYQTLACHLFKNRRWGVLQPSCLAVGLPGSLEEARLRATAAFMAGGQIDISDTLTTLPEDRWAVLTATLPPLGITAKPIDLFEPVSDGGAFSYATTSHGEDAVGQVGEHPPGSVWHLHVDADWDDWDLVALFSFQTESAADTPEVSRYAVPLARFGLSPETHYRAFEFWSAQHLGPIPGRRINADDYVHPGDLQDLKSGDASDILDLSFFGPGVKLLCLRRTRPHPWIAGTTFHQSCGTELRDVAWDSESQILSGTIDRPAGETGLLILDGADRQLIAAEADGQPLPCRRGANGAWILTLTVPHPRTSWRVSFASAQEGGR